MSHDKINFAPSPINTVRWRKWSVPYQYSTRMLIWILLVGSSCLSDAHKEVREIAEEVMEELEKLKAKKECVAELFN